MVCARAWDCGGASAKKDDFWPETLVFLQNLNSTIYNLESRFAPRFMCFLLLYLIVWGAWIAPLHYQLFYMFLNTDMLDSACPDCENMQLSAHDEPRFALWIHAGSQ